MSLDRCVREVERIVRSVIGPAQLHSAEHTFDALVASHRATVAPRAKAAETQPACPAGFAGFATPSATGPVVFPVCDATDLNQRPPTRGALSQQHHGVHNGIELIHFAPINYHSARSSGIWTVGAIFRPVRCLAPSSSPRSTALNARPPPPERASRPQAFPTGCARGS